MEKDKGKIGFLVVGFKCKFITESGDIYCSKLDHKTADEKCVTSCVTRNLEARLVGFVKDVPL